MVNILIILLVINFSTSNPTRPPGCDQTELSARWCASLDGGSLSDVLMVATSVRVLHRVHGHTTHLGPAVAFRLVFVVRTSSLQDGLVNTTTSGHDANHGSVVGRDHLLGTGRQLDPCAFVSGLCATTVA